MSLSFVDQGHPAYNLARTGICLVKDHGLKVRKVALDSMTVKAMTRRTRAHFARPLSLRLVVPQANHNQKLLRVLSAPWKILIISLALSRLVATW